MNLIILANGSFPESEYVLDILRNKDKIICCDGAADNLVRFGIEPDYIVGDIDSLSYELKQRLSEKIIHDSNQENNDLTKAFTFALTLSPSEIHILGATGKREDHTLGNISLLADYIMQTSCPIDIITDFGRFLPVRDNCEIACKPDADVSIFAFDKTLRIHVEGLQYPTDGVIFDTLWKATLNKTLSNSFTIEMNHPAPVIIFLERTI